MTFGGTTDSNETPRQTAIREFHEEGGYIPGDKKLNINEWTEQRITNQAGQEIAYFIGVAPNDITWKFNPKNNETKGGVWMTYDDLIRVHKAKPYSRLRFAYYVLQIARKFMTYDDPPLPYYNITLSSEDALRYKATLKEAKRIDKDNVLSNIEKQEGDTLSNLFIEHAKYRINLLRQKLKDNQDVRVTIAGNVSYGEHYLGKGLAVNQWIQNKYASKKEVSIYAWNRFMNILQIEIENLEKKYRNRVSYGTLVRTTASDINILVWGANSDNWDGDGKNNIPINGSGQAEAMSPYGPGVFGIITTPLTGLPPPPPPVNNKYLTYKNNFNQSKYYEKYLKYKLKYNQLKEKFN